MKVFISGVAGFLGGHLAEHYLRLGFTVVGVDNLLGGQRENVPHAVEFLPVDCNETARYAHLLPGCNIVYHCAAAPYEGLSPFSPALVYRHTLMSTVSLLSAAIAAGAGRFVLCSSMARYGAQPHPFTEDLTPAPVDPYGLAKVSAEQVVRNLCEFHGLEWAIAVPHNIYGPRQRYVDPFRNVVSIVINRMLSGQRPIVYGDGSQRRCFTYVEDILTPLQLMGTSGDAIGEVVNLGPDDGDVSILDLVKTVSDLLELDAEPLFVDPRPLEVHTATCSARKAGRLLGYQPTWSLEDGLVETIAWIRSKGPRPFEYHLPVEINTAQTPRTWADRLI